MKFPKFKDFLNENDTTQKTIAFDNINGNLLININFTEPEFYDNMRPDDGPVGTLKLSLTDKDNGIHYTYGGSDYDKSRDELLKGLLEIANEFDNKLKELLEKCGFEGISM